MKNEDLLPPIIKDLIASIRDDKTPIANRDMISARLENIVACCSEAVEAFRKKQTRFYSIQAKTKQKV